MKTVIGIWVAALALAGCPDDGGSAADASSDVADVAPDATDATDTADGADDDADTEEDVAPGLADNFGVEETEGEARCDNLEPTHCLFPFPSDRFRTVDADGARVTFGTALPNDADGVPLSSEHLEAFDGFSTITPIMFWLEGTDLTGAPEITDIAASLEADSPTVLLNAETGERVAHWVELDHFSVKDETPVVVIRPAQALAFGTRYVVGVRGLGAAPPGFAALRDGEASTWQGVHGRRERFEADVFGPLEDAGVARGELTLAWDFTTVSEDDATRDLLVMRDRMMEAIGDDGPEYTVTSVEAPDDPNVAVMVTGVAKVPSFLLPAEDNVRRIRRDADGLPLAEGFEDVEFQVQLPPAALAAPGEALVLQYGHGLFWGKAEARKDWLRETAARENVALVAIDLQGMSESDIAAWGEVLGADVARFPLLAEEPLQGLVNHLAIARMMQGRFAQDTDPAFTDAGSPLYDPSAVTYYGNSQGGTMGSILMAISPDVRRGVLGVPGCAFALLLQRSVGFATFAGLLRLTWTGRDFVVLLGLVQTGLVRMESLTYAVRTSGDVWPGAVDHRVLLHVAKEDATVDNTVSFMLGRTVGASLLQPAVRPVFGLPDATAPVTSGNVLAEFDFGHPDNPDPTKPPPEEFDTHEDLRRLRVAQDQLVHFLRTGEVIEVCDGVCDPD